MAGVVFDEAGLRGLQVLIAIVERDLGRDTATAKELRNLFDQRYEKRVFFFGNEDPDYIETRYEDRADPRQIGVTAAFRF